MVDEKRHKKKVVTNRAMSVTAKQEEESARWIREPLYWARKFGGESFDPWSGQVTLWEEYGKILNAKIKKYARQEMTEEEQRYARKFGMSIMAGQGVGKGASISLMGLHYVLVLKKLRSRVICTAPAGPQLHSSLWPEYGAWLQRSPVLGELFEKTSERIFRKDDKDRGGVNRIEPRTVQPHAAADEQKLVLAGSHTTGILYQIDEAAGVPDPCFEPIEGGMTDPLSMAVLIFNPVRRTGFAIETHRRNREMWVCLNWDGEALRKEKLQEPHRFKWFNEDVQLELAKKYGEESDFYRVRVKGLPPNQSSDSVIPFESVLAAREREITVLPGDPLVLYLDVGGEGENADPSILTCLRGPAVMWQRRYLQRDTQALASIVVEALAEEQAGLALETQWAVGVDYGGIGRGVYDALVNSGSQYKIRHVVKVDVSEQARTPMLYHRLRDQVFWELREAFLEQQTISLACAWAPDAWDELLAELTSIQWAMVMGSLKEKIKVQGKGSSSGIPNVRPLAKSPNRADSLAGAWYCYLHYTSRLPSAIRAKVRGPRRASSYKTI